jgi:hypothetical protein
VPLTPDEAKAKTESLYERLRNRRREVEHLEGYFKGRQPLAYASEEWASVHQGRYKNFADNWCGVVGSAPGERTEVTGFRVGEDTDTLSTEEKLLWSDWEANELPAQSSQGFLTSTIAKRSSVLVWGNDDDEPVVSWEHPAHMVVDYDPSNPRRRRAALKSWQDGDVEHATLYLPDEVWKFQRAANSYVHVDSSGYTSSGLAVVQTSTTFTPGSTGGWVQREDTGGEEWPLDNPLGVVPVVEFLNRPMLGGEPMSDIAGTIAMQDAVNLLWAYLFTAADFASMPARVVMGQEPPKVPILDENGQKIGEQPVSPDKLTRGRMLWLTGQSTSIGQWDAAKLDVFTEVINVAVKHIASQTKTPIHYIVGDLGNVNGETLVATETPLAMKVREAHKFYQSPIREVFRLMALVRGADGLADACRSGVVQWRDPETRSMAQVSDAALKDTQVGWPFEAVLERRYNMTQQEIARVMAMRANENADPTLERIARDLAAGGAEAPPPVV